MTVQALPVYPFDAARSIGTITEVAGTSAKVNLPRAASPGSMWHHGSHLEAGRVGEFVVVEASDHAVFGRIVSVRLPEKERLSVEEELGKDSATNPIGFVQLMATVALKDGRIEAGVPVHPRLGARCFSAHPELVQWLAQHSNAIKKETAMLLDIAVLPFSRDTMISIAPESLFGRHCAVLGATGGGKSWTLARLIEESNRYRSKIILIDATGEFHTQTGDEVVHRHLCNDSEAVGRGSVEVALPHSRLTESDLFALFQPSPQSQAPRLRAAIKSLKLISKKPSLGTDGLFKKANLPRAPYELAAMEFAADLDKPAASFEISKLASQIVEECIWPTGRGADTNNFGGANDTDLGYCANLIARIEYLVSSGDLACLFKPENKADLMSEIHDFYSKEEKRLFVLSLRELSFANNIREIVVNALGRLLLNAARRGQFSERPIIVFLDEAHQFVGKTLGDELTKLRLDSFELIAKEGRKYSLNLCLATQRPRDIGQGILSQMGTYLVHRLTNPEDRELIEKAAGDLDRSAASFIPTLAAGQAILIGIDFPIPVTLQMLEPTNKPASFGPKYQEHWAPPSE